MKYIYFQRIRLLKNKIAAELRISYKLLLSELIKHKSRQLIFSQWMEWLTFCFLSYLSTGCLVYFIEVFEFIGKNYLSLFINLLKIKLSYLKLIHIPEHTRSLSGSLLGYKTIP